MTQKSFNIYAIEVLTGILSQVSNGNIYPSEFRLTFQHELKNTIGSLQENAVDFADHAFRQRLAILKRMISEKARDNFVSVDLKQQLVGNLTVLENLIEESITEGALKAINGTPTPPSLSFLQKIKNIFR